MKVYELINELKKYDPNARVLLDSHGSCGIEEEDEIRGCYEDAIYDDDDNIIEKVVELYEY